MDGYRNRQMAGYINNQKQVCIFVYMDILIGELALGLSA